MPDRSLYKCRNPMNPNLEKAKRIIGERVELFARNREQYRHPDYKEARLRTEFLDPFFEALGWDVSNQQGLSEVDKEVISEDAIKIGETTRAPDYSFWIGRERKFFVEAKKPQLTLRADAGAAFQLRRYAWSAKLPLSILTDFEEFAVYDCRARPSVGDKASVGRIRFITFDQYLERLPEIYDLFSKEAVLRGSLERYAQEKGKRGTQPVDEEFLKEIEGWRAMLAKNIAALNPRLSLDELNDAVQRTIDRIIFLRMAEDRGAEEYGRLHNIALERPGIYQRFIALCREANTKYNSGLFDFERDTLTPALKIADERLRAILTSLYFPQSPYVFRELANDTLGNVYEQFLGKVIHLTPSHQARIEVKPEVKKAGGVYYTPAYIVEYIVKQTVGKLIAGKSPDEIAPLRILDPACGSGSFLLGAYQLLLDYHLDWYVEHLHAPQTRDRIYQTMQGWRLTTAEKKRILLNNIYGVDIDRQAVEVTKLSLLLKVLEDETQESLGKQLALFKEPALPHLDANIRCGNSLIGLDYFAEQLMPDPDERRRINPMDWEREFPGIMRNGGFDCVIGNPPYVRIQMMKEWAPREVELYKQKYAAASAGNYDLYVVFVEKGLSLLKPWGRLGFILPHKFFNAQYGAPLRELIARGKYLAHVVHFGDQQVFRGATTYTCLLFLDKAGSETCRVVKVEDLAAWRADGKAIEGTIPAEKITGAEWNFAVGTSAVLFEKLRQMPVKLGDVAKIFVGTQTSADDVFVLDECRRVKNYIIGTSKALGKEVKIESGCVVPFLRGKEIRRYMPLEATAYLICPYEISTDEFRLYTLQEMSRKFPLAMAYLEANKATLVSREKGRFKGENWYAFGYPKSMTLFQKSKIVVPDYNNVVSFTLDTGGHFYKTGYGIIANDTSLSLLYLLGLLNSPLMFQYLRSIGTELRGGYVRFWTQYISQLPIRVINFDDPNDALQHRRLVTLVTQMLELHKQLRAARIAADREMLQRQIDATDEQINALVYALYGLTEEEIAAVEGGE
jgi:hypothetical protein